MYGRTPRLTTKSKGYKVLSAIQDPKDGLSKYEWVTTILGKEGSRNELRGYYCVTFQGWREAGIVVLNNGAHKYSITELGLERLRAAREK